MKKRSVVFELTDREIRAFWFSVHPFRKQGHSSTAVTFDRLPIPTGVIEQGNVRDETMLTDILSAYGAEHLGENQKVYLAVPLQQGYIRSHTLPWINRRDRKSTISLLVNEEISIARSDLLFDFLVLAEEKHKDLHILLGATRKSLLSQVVYIFGEAGFKVTGVDFAFSSLGQSLGFEPNEDVLYLEGQSGSFQVVLFRGEVPESVRSLNGQAEESETEIRRFLLYYRTQHSDLNLKRLVWNGDSMSESLAQSLLTSKQVSSVEKAKLKNVPEAWSKILEENAGWGEVAVGYGIRVSARIPALNLWRQPSIIQSAERRSRGIALFLAAIFMMGTIAWYSLYQMAFPLQQETQKHFLQGTKIEAQAKQQEDLQVAWNKITRHTERISDGMAQIQTMQASLGAELKLEQVMYKKGSMSLRGSAKDAKSVQNLISTLRIMGWEQPALTSYKLTSLDNVEFSLSAKHGLGRTENSTPALGEGG